ncbi:MAG: YdeI/OmpD-associated family protein [Bacteroidales bacterium]
MVEKKEQPIISFGTPSAWETWLSKNHDSSAGVWLRFFKKGSGIPTVVYAEALDVALCYGWIDGQLQRCDEQSYLRKFTPRRPQSLWSKQNIEHVLRLEKEGKMKPAGIKAFESAKADGRLEKAYDSPGKMSAPDDFLKALKKDAEAFAFFESLNKANKYAIAWRLQTAKNPATREKRMKMLLEMLLNGKKLHE